MVMLNDEAYLIAMLTVIKLPDCNANQIKLPDCNANSDQTT